MSQQQLDAHGEAHEALGTAVSSYGPRVLSDPRILGNLVTDLLPDLPRERSLLVTGAEAGVAAEITRHVEEQHVDPDTAVQLVARALSERRAIDPAASMWVASEYAQALGYQVRPYAQPFQPEQPQVIPAAPPTLTSMPGKPTLTQPPPMVAPAAQVPQRPPTQSWPPEQSWPPTQPPPGRPTTSRTSRKRNLIAATTAVGVVAVYLIVSAVTHTVPFSNSHPVARTTPTVKPTHKPTRTATPVPILAPGVAPLTQLLPGDIADPATECQPVQKPYGWSMPGLVQALDCNDPGLSKGFVQAYQMNNRANFETAWRNFNSGWSFDTSTAETKCPPSSSSAQGLVPWNGPGFPSVQGQVIECQLGPNAAPYYAWTMPTQDTFLIAAGANGSSFKALDTWWTNNSGPANPPTASPSPKAS